MKDQYLSYIDGLRALAVTYVVLFHAFPLVFPGGFLGVDIFFVISGFLIGRQIVTEIRSGTFSFIHFYMRRIRRLFPALFVVYIATLIVGGLILPPSEFSALTLTLRASLLLVSNFHFANRTGYFDEDGSASPLLHTWSLSVEEQFYLVAPIIIYFVMKHRPSWLISIIYLLFLLSIISSLLSFHRNPEKAFFLTHARVWEILLGIYIAMYSPPPRISALRSFVGGAALIVILTLVFVPIDHLSTDIQIKTFVICGATALLISSVNHSSSQFISILSHRYLLSVGKLY